MLFVHVMHDGGTVRAPGMIVRPPSKFRPAVVEDDDVMAPVVVVGRQGLKVSIYCEPFA